MFSSLALIKAFFSHWFGILITVIIICLAGVIWYQHHENGQLTNNIATLNQKIGAIKANDAQWQGAASDCSVATAAVAASEASATQAASEAVAIADVKAKMYTDHAKKVLAQKPASSDDYTASKQLMDGLIDNRQSILQKEPR